MGWSAVYHGQGSGKPSLQENVSVEMLIRAGAVSACPRRGVDARCCRMAALESCVEVLGADCWS